MRAPPRANHVIVLTDRWDRFTAEFFPFIYILIMVASILVNVGSNFHLEPDLSIGVLFVANQKAYPQKPLGDQD